MATATEKTQSEIIFISYFVTGLSFCLLLAAIWWQPIKILFEPGNSYLLFPYIYDEPFYADRLQPLLSGTTRANPENGLGDSEFISQFYLEDTIRAGLTLTGASVSSVFWASRFIFPAIIFSLIYLLARDALKMAGFDARISITLTLTVLTGLLLFSEPFLYYKRPPAFGWLWRFPTNLEFIHSLLLGWLYIRTMRSPTANSITCLAVAFSALVYLRFYTAIPWGILFMSSVIALAVQRKLHFHQLRTAGAIFIICMLPWALIAIHNSHLPIQQELLRRYFPPVPWRIHAQANVYFIAAATMLGATLCSKGLPRILGLLFSTTTLSLVVACSAFFFRKELLEFERFSSFYLTGIICVSMLSIGGFLSNQSFHLRFYLTASLLALISSCFIFSLYWHLDLERLSWSPYSRIKLDLPSIPAYRWIESNTARDALILVDFGAMTKMPETELQTVNVINTDNLFKTVAKRRKAFDGRLFVSCISNRDLLALGRLYGCVFSELEVEERTLRDLLRIYRPGYIVWYKSNPRRQHAPTLLKLLCESIYSDEEREVWKINLDRL